MFWAPSLLLFLITLTLIMAKKGKKDKKGGESVACVSSGLTLERVFLPSAAHDTFMVLKDLLNSCSRGLVSHAETPLNLIDLDIFLASAGPPPLFSPNISPYTLYRPKFSPFPTLSLALTSRGRHRWHENDGCGPGKER